MKSVIHRRFSQPGVRNVSVAWLFVIVAGLCLGSAATAQQLDTPPWPENPPELVDILVGWDFTGMTGDETDGFWGIINPLTQKEIEDQLTSEQRLERQAVERTIINPSTTPPNQSTDAQLAQYVISHPIEYKQWADKQKTPEQLREEAISMWTILHPIEASQIAQSLKTPEEIKAQIQAQVEAANPQLKPKPILKQVPFNEAVPVSTDIAQPQN
jgi:hypothetical protein